MRITAIFENAEAADAAVKHIAQRVPIQGRQTTPMTGRDYDSLTSDLYPGIAAGGYVDGQATGGMGQGIWQDTLPFPWLIPAFGRPEPEERSREVRLALDVAEEDIHTVESLLINQHGRSIQIY